jgi:hypothetical protein
MMVIENSPFRAANFQKVADHFNDLDPSALSRALCKLDRSPTLMAAAAEVGVWKLDFMSPEKRGDILVGLAIYGDTAPKALYSDNTKKLLVGYDDIIRTIDMDTVTEAKLIQRQGTFQDLAATKDGAIATFETHVLVLDKNGDVRFEFENDAPVSFLCADTTGPNKLRISFVDYLTIEVDMLTREVKKLSEPMP